MSTQHHRSTLLPYSAWLATLALLAGACGSGDHDECTPPQASCSVGSSSATPGATDPPVPTTGEASAGTGDTGGGPATCDACGVDQVCIAGTCTDVPSSCPCPLETYCNLVTEMCVIGCTSDDECDEGRICDTVERVCFPGCREDGECGAGEICEGLVCGAGCRTNDDCGPMELCDKLQCRQGCTGDADCPKGEICSDTVCRVGCGSDAECSKPGDICDPDTMVCRAGCHADADCPLAQLCDDQTLACVPGCNSNSKCAPGQICKGGQCTTGCADNDGCPLGQICIAEKCETGCALDGGGIASGMTDRCSPGTACVPAECDANNNNCVDFKCTVDCKKEKLPCSSSVDRPFVCGRFYESFDTFKWRCVEKCGIDADCPAGQVCHENADPPNDAFHFAVLYCRAACNEFSCKDMFNDTDLTQCTCETNGPKAGHCLSAGNECEYRYPPN